MEDSTVRYDNVKFKEFYNVNQQDCERLQNLYNNLKRSINKYHNGKYEICFYLNALKEFFNKFEKGVNIGCEYERTSGMIFDCDFYEFCERFFCLTKKTVQRYVRVYNRFFNNIFSAYYENELKKFDVSKLVELLRIEDDKVIVNDLGTSRLNPFMTRKEIVKWVESKRDAGVPIVDNSAEEINEDEIPEVYDPSKHYEDKYFMGLAKSQLVNNIVALQDYCEKLQEKIKELKKKKAL